MTLIELKRIMPFARLNANRYYEFLLNAMQEFEINTPERKAAFLASIGHESGQLRYVEEIASGVAYDTGRLAKRLGNTVEKDGDGQKYKGRGLIQITGRHNYIAAMMALGIDCVERPEILAEPENACRVSAWYWKEHGLNELADAGKFQAISGLINTGSAKASTRRINGWEDRLALYNRARSILV